MKRLIPVLFPIVVTVLTAGAVAAQELPSPTGRAGAPPTGPAPPGAGRFIENHTPGVPGEGVAAAGSPDHPPFEQFVVAGATEYGVVNNVGVYVSEDGGASWSLRDKGLPRRMVYPFEHTGVETITGIGVDPLDPRRVAVTTSLGLWVSSSSGRIWVSLPLGAPIARVAYITSVALSPWSRTTFAVGTSFGGLFETTDGGKSWRSLSGTLAFLYRGAGFYEEIAGVSYSPVERGALYVGVGFGGSVYRSDSERSSWTSLAFPVGRSENSPAIAKGRNEVIRRLSTGLIHGEPVVSVATDSQLWQYSLRSREWRTTGDAPRAPAMEPAKAKRIAAAANRSALYLAAGNASGARLRRMIDLAKTNGLNAVVVDAKDDFGHLTFDSHLRFAREIGAVRPVFDLPELVKLAHENGIYVVARMVVFKDEVLYRYDNHRYAVWEVGTNRPWGERLKEIDPKSGAVSYVQREYWVDPFSQDVWRYNVAIAAELEETGVDEVQFDYIRFPSDGPLADARYRFQREGMTRIDALESYMVMARKALRVPISTDLYGFNSWYRMGNWIGQNIEMLARYVDVVCPMFYPSHFPAEFMEKVPYLERAKDIYRSGTRRAKEIVRGRADIRPFVQAFLLEPKELSMSEETYSRYLRMQLEGAMEAQSSGFTLWNAANDYFMVTAPLTPYIAQRE